MAFSVNELIQKGIRLKDNGDPEGAIHTWREALARDPENLQAQQLIARTAIMHGDMNLAVEILTQAVRLAPAIGQLRHDLAIAYRESGQAELALEHMQQAAALAPESAEILNNLGGLFERSGDRDAALSAYANARNLAPHHPAPYLNSADIWLDRKQHDKAIDYFRIAATLDPYLAGAWFGLGRALVECEKAAAALGPLQRAVELEPNNIAAQLALADAQQSCGSTSAARDTYRKVLELNPEQAQAWYGLGYAQLAQGHSAVAEHCLQHCVKLAPNHLPARNDLGKVLHDLGCVEQSMQHFRFVACHACGPLRDHALRNLAVIAPGNPQDDNVSILKIRQEWAQSCHDRGVVRTRRQLSMGRDRRIKIAYVSSFFHRPNWMKPVWALLNNHDRKRFHVHLFSDAEQARLDVGYHPDPTDFFCDITELSNAQVAQRIADAGVELLVDLNGYSVPRRLALFAHRPSPVIIAWFNMYATSGMPWFDYLIGDHSVIPSEEELYYCEQILRVEHSYLSFTVEHPAPEPVPPPCLNNGFVTMGCLASQYKINDAVLAAWSLILSGAENARLLIRNAALGNPDTQAHLKQRMHNCAIDVSRVMLQGPAPHYEFLQTYNQIDFALDTFPYNGGTTTTEAIWQGVPVLTFNGDRWVSRTSASILNGAGLSDWVAANSEAHIEQAIQLANERNLAEMLAPLRAQMRTRLRASAVMNAPLFAANMERLYLQIAQRGSIDR